MKKKIRIILNYIKKNFHKKNLLDEIIKELGLNITRYYFTKEFKKLTGIKFNTYIKKIRIKKAKKLIKNREELLIKEIGYILGYKNFDHFRKQFKEEVGLSPIEYRKNI